MATVGRRDSFLSNIIPQCVFLLIIMMSASSSNAITNLLTSGQTLGWNEKLGYPKSKVSLSWNPFCNIVLNDDQGVSQWKSGTGGLLYFGCTLSLNNNGRLVLTGFFQDQVWISDNANSAAGKYVAILRPEAELVIYGPAIWTVGASIVKESSIGISSTSDNNNNEVVSSMTNLKNTPYIYNVLFSGQTLKNGENISENGYALILDDCELILKDSHGTNLWQTFTRGHSINCDVWLDFDGRLEIFDESATVVWTNKKQLPSSQSLGEYALVIQSDGIVNLYGPDVWSRPKHPDVWSRPKRSSRRVTPRDELIKMPTV